MSMPPAMPSFFNDEPETDGANLFGAPAQQQQAPMPPGGARLDLCPPSRRKPPPPLSHHRLVAGQAGSRSRA